MNTPARSVTATETLGLRIPPAGSVVIEWLPAVVEGLGEYAAVVGPVLEIDPAEALPPSIPSTNHESVALPPDRVAVNIWGWEVVTAERWGETTAVTPLGTGGGDGPGLKEELPPPQEVSPRERKTAIAAPKRIET